MAFYRGQPVVYIGPDFRSHPLTVRYHVSVPVPDCIYRTRSDEMIWQDTLGYLLEGIVNQIHPHIGQEMIVDKHFLRPLAKTDMEFFLSGAPTGTKWLDNRHKRKQKVSPVWRTPDDVVIREAIEQLEQRIARYEQEHPRKAAG